MARKQDLFPTRLERKLGMFERLDPVVHAEGRDRTDGPLSEAKVSEFERNGFLSFPGFFTEGEMEGFLTDMREYQKNADLKLSEGAILEPGNEEIRSIFCIHEISSRFSRLTRDPRLLDMVHQLMGSDVYIHQSRINYKPGFKGKGFNWHSDFETWHSEDGMPKMRSVSCLHRPYQQWRVQRPVDARARLAELVYPLRRAHAGKQLQGVPEESVPGCPG